MDDHLRGDGADGQSNKLVTIEFICRKSTMQDQSRILVMVILLLLDYAQGKVRKEVFISDGGNCRRRSRVMVASRSRRSWMTMRILRRNGARLSSCSFSFSHC